MRNISLTDRTVSTNLRRRRLELGYTQQAVAKALGVSVQQLQKYEKCTNRLTSGKLEALAKLLDVSIVYFFQSDRYSGYIDSLGDQIKERQAMTLWRLLHKIQSHHLKNEIVEVLSFISEKVMQDHNSESEPL